MGGNERWHRTGWRCEGCGHWNCHGGDLCAVCGFEAPELEEDWDQDEEEGDWYEEFDELGGEE